MIKWIFFDWDGTIVPDFGDYFWQTAFPRLLAKERRITLAEAMRTIYALSVDGVRYTDMLSPHSVRWLSFEPWAEQLGTKITFEQVFAAAEHKLYIRPEVRELLADLAARYRLGLITNCVSKFLTLCLARLGLEELFTVRVSCDQVSVTKPNPAIFKAALGLAGCEPREALYVGDKWADDRGAATAGMRLVLVCSGRFVEDIPPGTMAIRDLLELPELLGKL